MDVIQDYVNAPDYESDDFSDNDDSSDERGKNIQFFTGLTQQ